MRQRWRFSTLFLRESQPLDFVRLESGPTPTKLDVLSKCAGILAEHFSAVQIVASEYDVSGTRFQSPSPVVRCGGGIGWRKYLILPGDSVPILMRFLSYIGVVDGVHVMFVDGCAY
jgi:hypothetical protein